MEGIGRRFRKQEKKPGRRDNRRHSRGLREPWVREGEEEKGRKRQRMRERDRERQRCL